MDTVMFGDVLSETAHGFNGMDSEAAKGALGEPMRRLLLLKLESWEGGRLSFKMKVDPEKGNYITVRFSGDDVTQNRLLLYVAGKQIGYRHLGDIDQLDFGSGQPAYRGRFVYNTSPLPLELTRGKTEAAVEIRSSGPIWGYGRHGNNIRSG